MYKGRKPPKGNRRLRSKHDAIEAGVHGAIDGHTDENGLASRACSVRSVVAADVRNDPNDWKQLRFEGTIPAVHPLDIGDRDRK